MKATVTYTIEFEIDSDMDFWEDGREKNDWNGWEYAPEPNRKLQELAQKEGLA